MATIKVLELIGVSDKSWHDAVEHALQEASRTGRGITRAMVAAICRRDAGAYSNLWHQHPTFLAVRGRRKKRVAANG